MKRLAIIAVALPLAGCGPSFPTIDGSALAEAVAQVRGHTIKICSYFPSDDSLVAILTANVPVVETAYNIAKQICDAVTASVPPVSPTQMAEPKEGEKNQCPMVRGVCITGRFLQPGTGAAGPTDKPPAADPNSPDAKSIAPGPCPEGAQC